VLNAKPGGTVIPDGIYSPKFAAFPPNSEVELEFKLERLLTN